MLDRRDFPSKTIDKAVVEMIAKAEDEGVTTVWDRLEAMEPQCGFGDTGLCCRHCLQGPCRIDPFGDDRLNQPEIGPVADAIDNHERRLGTACGEKLARMDRFDIIVFRAVHE